MTCTTNKKWPLFICMYGRPQETSKISYDYALFTFHFYSLFVVPYFPFSFSSLILHAIPFFFAIVYTRIRKIDFSFYGCVYNYLFRIFENHLLFPKVSNSSHCRRRNHCRFHANYLKFGNFLFVLFMKYAFFFLFLHHQNTGGNLRWYAFFSNKNVTFCFAGCFM